ncbi:adhesion G-protein coupled receptor G5-like [Cottoperca gobio]|uniref:Adhesion G-protein coupled receptor G5-like n=1 Tax=Cottoperca gobio TaxID=56716 RepID=A0A6J2S8S1_COTGO|nr:adhesion G-protein coupled receptor G5-like [Cottoperca gobio]XP_029318369.1 adhesion G-protein coupled receptor G5-like [Cottoperca gobio]
MEPRLTDHLRVVLIFIILISTGSSENDLDSKFCGTWRHGKGSLSLNVNISTGCDGISISANQSALSIDGQITAQCRRLNVIQLGLDSEEETHFCLYWEPLLDQLKLQVGGKNLTLCWPASLQGRCCTDLSDDLIAPEAAYGIKNGMVKTDLITPNIRTAYRFKGQHIDCKALCDQESQRSTQGNMTEQTAVMSLDGGRIEHPCARSIEVEMKEDFRGYNVTSPATKGVSAESTTTVHLPPALKQAAKKTSKVVCTFFQNNSLFQEVHKKARILDDVVGITMENEVITNLSEPIRIAFHHDVIPIRHSRKCVSWDTRKDPLQVNWLVDGCEIGQKGAKHTECLCTHLTYFTVLVQMEPRPVRHLLALTAITSLGCAVSVISCVALIIFLFRKSRRCNEQSIPIHLGLAVSLAFLNLLFFFTGVLANVGGESVCVWVGAGLQYTLLSSFTWMGIEVFHTFWLVYRVFSPFPKYYVWYLVGFVLPAVPIIILAAVGDIYGVREVVPSDDVANPYLMCWMKDNHKALLAHYFTNMTILAILVSSGIVMLFLVYREIRTRDEWRQNRVAFLSIWGLSCLFGATWGLTFLDFGPLSDFILFLSCILNSFQGFLLMLRFYMLDWMRKQAGGSALGSSSSGSTRQHMLQAQEKS